MLLEEILDTDGETGKNLTTMPRKPQRKAKPNMETEVERRDNLSCRLNLERSARDRELSELIYQWELAHVKKGATLQNMAEVVRQAVRAWIEQHPA